MNSTTSIELGNLLQTGNYSEVIRRGEEHLQQHQDDAGVHVILMDAYFKMRSEEWANVQRSADHAKAAILLGHDTGYCHERLLKDLREMDYYYQELQLCLMVMRPDFEFSSRGCGKKDYFAKAAATVRKRIDQGRAKDNPDAVVFTPQQIEQIIRMTREYKKREAEANKLWIKIEKAYHSGNNSEYNRLMKQYHKLQESL